MKFNFIILIMLAVTLISIITGYTILQTFVPSGKPSPSNVMSYIIFDEKKDTMLMALNQEKTIQIKLLNLVQPEAYIYLEVDVPDGLSIVSGDTKWEGKLIDREGKIFYLTVKGEEVGKWTINATAYTLDNNPYSSKLPPYGWTSSGFICIGNTTDEAKSLCPEISPGEEGQQIIESYITVKINDIIQNPFTYEGEMVIIKGKYGGWIYGGNVSVCNEGPQESRSDWEIYDETGCIYVSIDAEILESSGELVPWKSETIGANVTIRGLVKVSDKNIPYIGG